MNFVKNFGVIILFINFFIVPMCENPEDPLSEMPKSSSLQKLQKAIRYGCQKEVKEVLKKEKYYVLSILRENIIVFLSEHDCETLKQQLQKGGIGQFAYADAKRYQSLVSFADFNVHTQNYGYTFWFCSYKDEADILTKILLEKNKFFFDISSILRHISQKK